MKSSDLADRFHKPSEKQIRLYYFTFSEAVELLQSSDWRLRQALRKKRYGQVRRNGTWMIPPDQIEPLRSSLSMEVFRD